MSSTNESVSNKNVWLAIALAVITSITSLGTALIKKDDDSINKEEKNKAAETLNNISTQLGALDSSVKHLTRTIDKLEVKVEKNTIRSITSYAALSSADMTRSEGVMSDVKKSKSSTQTKSTAKHSDERGEWTPAFSIRKKKVKRKKKKKRRSPASIVNTSAPAHLDESLLKRD